MHNDLIFFSVFSISTFIFRITSPHNAKVVEEVIKSIGTDKFPEEQIRSMYIAIVSHQKFKFITYHRGMPDLQKDTRRKEQEHEITSEEKKVGKITEAMSMYSCVS